MTQRQTPITVALLTLSLAAVSAASASSPLTERLLELDKNPPATKGSLPTVQPGFILTAIPGVAGGSLAPDPADPNSFYILGGGYQSATIQKLTLTSDRYGATTGTLTTIATGTATLGGSLADGDDVLDNNFGDGGLAVLSTAPLRIVVSDNDYGTSSGVPNVIGDTIVLLEDLNGDGDCRDIVGGVREASEYIAPIATSGTFGFTGGATAVDGSGAVFVVTSDGNSTEGEVLRVAPSAASIGVYFGGLEFGSGLVVDDGASTPVFAGNSSFGNNAVFGLADGNADDDAQDPGEANATALDGNGPSSLAKSGEGLVYVTQNDFVSVAKITVFDPAAGSLAEFASDLPDGFAGSLAFDSGSGAFTAFAGEGERRLLLSTGFGAGSSLHVIEPAPVSAAVGTWETYE